MTVYEFAFICAQIGLVVCFVFAFAIVDLLSREESPPPAYYVWIVWGVAIGCAKIFSWGIERGPIESESALYAYAGAVLFGIEHMAGYLRLYAKNMGTRMASTTVRYLNWRIGIGLGVLLLAAIIHGAYFNSQDLTAATALELKRQTKHTAAVLDSRMQARNDSLTTEILKNRAETADLTHKLDEQGTQITALLRVINRLTDVITSLKRSVGRVDANVERSRKAIPNARKVTLDTLGMIVEPRTLNYVTPTTKHH